MLPFDRHSNQAYSVALLQLVFLFIFLIKAKATAKPASEMSPSLVAAAGTKWQAKKQNKVSQFLDGSVDFPLVAIIHPACSLGLKRPSTLTREPTLAIVKARGTNTLRRAERERGKVVSLKVARGQQSSRSGR